MTEIKEIKRKIESFGGSKRLVITWGNYNYFYKEGDIEYLVDVLNEEITGIVIENFLEKQRKIIEEFKEEVKKTKMKYLKFKDLGVLKDEK